MIRHSVVNLLAELDRIELIHSLEIPSVEELNSMFESFGEEDNDNNKEAHQRKELNIKGMTVVWKEDGMHNCKKSFSIELLEEMKKHELRNCVYRDSSGNEMDRDELAQKIVDIIKWNEGENKKRMSDSAEGHDEKGRFESHNINAEKYLFQEEYIYILYLLYQNMNKVGELLGISRQTVSKKIEAYKQNREKKK